MFLDGCIYRVSRLEFGHWQGRMREGTEGQPAPPVKASCAWPLGPVQGEGPAPGLRHEDSACGFQWVSPALQVGHLPLVLQVETKILKRTNSRKKHSREEEEKRKHNMENLFFLSPATVSSPKVALQARTNWKLSGERLDRACCWELWSDFLPSL